MIDYPCNIIAIKIETKILICIFANREEDDYEVTLDDITFSDDEVEPDPTQDNYAEIDFSSFDTFSTAPTAAATVPDTTTMTTRSRRVKKEKNEKKEKKVKKEPKLVKPKLEKKKVKLLVFIFFLI